MLNAEEYEEKEETEAKLMKTRNEHTAKMKMVLDEAALLKKRCGDVEAELASMHIQMGVVKWCAEEYEALKQEKEETEAELTKTREAYTAKMKRLAANSFAAHEELERIKVDLESVEKLSK